MHAAVKQLYHRSCSTNIIYNCNNLCFRLVVFLTLWLYTYKGTVQCLHIAQMVWPMRHAQLGNYLVRLTQASAICAIALGGGINYSTYTACKAIWEKKLA